MSPAGVTVHALSTGHITLPERFFISPSDPSASRTVPSLSFLIQHRTADNKLTRLVFDLGMRRDISLYPEVLHKHCASRSPISTRPDAVESLAKGGLTVNDIDYIIFSHVHYDHVGMPIDFSDPNTKFIVGPGALDLLSGKVKLRGSHSTFEPDLLPLDRTIELPPTPASPSTSSSPNLNSSSTFPLNQIWHPLPPFPSAIDLFSDQTIFILSAPGHLPGHVNLLCQTQVQPPKYVLLAGDACHDMRLFTGERDIGTWTDDEGRTCCIHADIPAAKETIRRLVAVEKEGLVVGDTKVEVEVVFAHNWEWELDAVERDRFWPGKM